MNYQELKTEIEKPAYAGKTDEEIVGILNTPIAGALDYRERTIVTNYAANYDIIRRLKAIVRAPYEVDSPYDTEIPNTGGYTLREVADEGISFFTINTGELINPNNPKLQGCVAILQAMLVFNQTEIEGFWNVFRNYSLMFNQEVTLNDLNAARWVEQSNAFKDYRSSLIQQLATVDGCISDLDSGHAYHELNEVQE